MTPSTPSRSTACRAHYHAHRGTDTRPGCAHRSRRAFFAATGADIRHGGDRAFYAIHADRVQMPRLRDLPRRRKPTTRRSLTNARTGRAMRPVSIVNSAGSAGATRDTPRRSWSPNSAARFSAPISASTPEPREDHASLYRELAARAQERQAGDLHRRRSRRARRCVPAWGSRHRGAESDAKQAIDLMEHFGAG